MSDVLESPNAGTNINYFTNLKSLQEINDSIGNQISNNLNIHALHDVSKSITFSLSLRHNEVNLGENNDAI